jgi:hypothetical protein
MTNHSGTTEQIEHNGRIFEIRIYPAWGPPGAFASVVEEKGVRRFSNHVAGRFSTEPEAIAAAKALAIKLAEPVPLWKRCLFAPLSILSLIAAFVFAIVFLLAILAMKAIIDLKFKLKDRR